MKSRRPNSKPGGSSSSSSLSSCCSSWISSSSRTADDRGTLASSVASADLNRAEDRAEDPLSTGRMDRTGEVEVQRDANGPAPRYVERRGGLELATRDNERDGGAVAQNPVHRIHDEPELGVLSRGSAVQREEPREIREGDEIDGRGGQWEMDPTALVPRIRAMDLDVREHDVQLLPLGRRIADVHVERSRRDGTQERNPADEKQAGDRHGKHGARPHRPPPRLSFARRGI